MATAGTSSKLLREKMVRERMGVLSRIKSIIFVVREYLVELPIQDRHETHDTLRASIPKFLHPRDQLRQSACH
jgi:hypothetical protein